MMSSYIIHELSKSSATDFGYLFGSPRYYSLKGFDMRHFSLNSGDRVIAKIGFAIDGEQAISGLGATFGSLDTRSEQPIEELVKFIKDCSKRLFDQGIKEIVVRQPALCYPQSELVTDVLMQSGFNIILTETNQHITISQLDYKNILRKNEQKKLKQCLREGYNFQHLDITYLPQVYDLICDTRSRKGYPITMTFEELEDTIRSFPEAYMLLGIFDNDLLIAASVTIRLSAEVVYNFYHADHFDYRSKSPLVMLVGEIYSFCQKNGSTVLDLGISSKNAVLNKGLFKFKENIGAEVSLKNSFQLKNA